MNNKILRALSVFFISLSFFVLIFFLFYSFIDLLFISKIGDESWSEIRNVIFSPKLFEGKHFF